MVEYLKLRPKHSPPAPNDGRIQPKNYTATIHTEKGDIVIALYADKAPWAVNSFVYLAEQGWYNGSGFFRLYPGSSPRRATLQFGVGEPWICLLR